jgi:hypothetical protein
MTDENLKKESLVEERDIPPRNFANVWVRYNINGEERAITHHDWSVRSFPMNGSTHSEQRAWRKAQDEMEEIWKDAERGGLEFEILSIIVTSDLYPCSNLETINRCLAYFENGGVTPGMRLKFDHRTSRFCCSVNGSTGDMYQDFIDAIDTEPRYASIHAAPTHTERSAPLYIKY